MKLIRDYGNGAQIWHDPEYDEYYVYGVLSDPRVCPSLGMAESMAAAGAT